jgi:hypothetical protein
LPGAATILTDVIAILLSFKLNFEIISHSMPRHLPIHYSLIVLQIDAISTELLTSTSNMQETNKHEIFTLYTYGVLNWFDVYIYTL